MGAFTDKWNKASDETKYKIREQSGLRAKIQHCNQMYWREDNEWIVKHDNQRFSQPDWCGCVALCLELKYGIKVKVTKEKPLTYEVLPDSQPILNDERFAAAIDPESMSHIKGLSPIDWQVIHQCLSKLAYHKDPNTQTPAALVVLKKLQGNVNAT